VLEEENAEADSAKDDDSEDEPNLEEGLVEFDDHLQWMHTALPRGPQQASTRAAFMTSRLRIRVRPLLEIFLQKCAEQEREEQMMFEFAYGSEHVTAMPRAAEVEVYDRYKSGGVELVNEMSFGMRRKIVQFLRETELAQLEQLESTTPVLSRSTIPVLSLTESPPPVQQRGRATR
jgi:hypothetical protein